MTTTRWPPSRRGPSTTRRRPCWTGWPRLKRHGPAISWPTLVAAFDLPESFLARRPITSPHYPHHLFAHTREITTAWRPTGSPDTAVPAPPTAPSPPLAVPEATTAAGAGEHSGGTR